MLYDQDHYGFGAGEVHYTESKLHAFVTIKLHSCGC